ncbi:RNA-binding protein [Bifidobacterium bohemicum]|uniref:RNA-binding protein CRS1 / YhbY (CRM) domain n=1 Tax=Bifidobacterium bohemicum DSM 22767 TaxID=1437606 RepID=A0A086ZFZ1_9BIFI|nr:YhbY family RNA-binding protein [Bifidobacterium bohemicum]KFI45441.1 RNA-binding protein CRS1 / YhbY (CRM) domain [Bifidobacterium bohemicum DSM 22767]SCB72868.1 RNA-binding protein [Bifidobacterium bohemicum]
MTVELNKRQVKQLKALASKINPMLWIGRNGVTEAAIKQASETLESHELLKVVVQDGCPVDEREVGETLAGNVGATLVQVIGHRLVLYRPTDKEGVERIRLVR